MRISTSMLFGTGTKGLQSLQSDLYKLQNQMSTGRRVLTPSDDPISAWEALQVSQSKSVNKQYLDNQGDAKAKLAYMEGNMSSVSDALIRVRELSAGAVNTTAEQRALLVPELKGILDNVLTLANAKDGTGNYIYSGNKSATTPFALTSTGATYAGDQGQQALRVSASNVMTLGHNGFEVFMQVRDGQGSPAGGGIFDALQGVINILDPSSGVPFSEAALTQFNDQIDNSIGHMANMIASVGTRLNTLDALSDANSDSALLYEMRLSDLQDLDYTAAISDFSRIQTQLEAAQITFKQTSQLSLFNIL